MKTGASVREPARVVMHLDGGFTKIVLERTIGVGLADGGICWDIPTARIPHHLRRIGSTFLVVTVTFRAEPHDSAEAIRSAVNNLAIEELVDSK